MVKQHEECWCSTRCTLISVKIRSDQTGQGVLLECWGSVYRWFTSISAVNGIGDAGTGSLVGVLVQCPALAQLELRVTAAVRSARLGQRVLQECWGSAQRWFNSISNTMASTLSGKGGFELRDVVKPLAFFYRHHPLLACCHLFSRHERP